MKQHYTLTIYSEDQMGLISKIAIILSRRKISLESLNISTCEIDNMYRFTLVIEDFFEIVRNIVLQIEKIIEVYKCYYNTNEEIIYKQLLLYKIPTSSYIDNENAQYLFKKHNVRLVSIQNEYTVFEVTGQEEDIDNLLVELNKYKLVEFIKSGRIAFVIASKGFQSQLHDMENNRK